MDVDLWNEHQRKIHENFSELYAIIKATEKLEMIFICDDISTADYEIECQKLIAQFNTLSYILRDTMPCIQGFHDTYCMDCPAAIKRLVISGVPATVEHSAAAAAAASGLTLAASVALCAHHFITAIGALKLKMTAADEVRPVLSDVSRSLNKLSFLPPDFEGKTKFKEWMVRVSKMGAADKLTEEQARQLHFDLKSSYDDFRAALPTAGK